MAKSANFSAKLQKKIRDRQTQEGRSVFPIGEEIVLFSPQMKPKVELFALPVFSMKPAIDKWINIYDTELYANLSWNRPILVQYGICNFVQRIINKKVGYYKEQMRKRLWRWMPADGTRALQSIGYPSVIKMLIEVYDICFKNKKTLNVGGVEVPIDFPNQFLHVRTPSLFNKITLNVSNYGDIVLVEDGKINI